MTKFNKNKREDAAAFAALALVFGAPFLGVLTIIDSPFGVVLILAVAFFIAKAFGWRPKMPLWINNCLHNKKVMYNKSKV